MLLMKKSLLLVLFLFFIAGFVTSQNNSECTMLARSLDQLAKGEIENSVDVGGTLIANSFETRYYSGLIEVYGLTFKGIEEELKISRKLSPDSKHEIGKFYKFNVKNIWTYSPTSQEGYADPELNKLEEMNC